MSKASTLFVLSFSLLISACSSKSTSENNAPASTGQVKPISVETKAPNNSKAKPAFAGQTRIGAIKTATPFEGVVISSDLKRPWGITSLPDGRLLITEKNGSMRIATTSGTLSTPISGLLEVNSSGQGGLLGVTLDPDFALNRMVTGLFRKPCREGI